jgi:hypothetical protein
MITASRTAPAATPTSPATPGATDPEYISGRQGSMLLGMNQFSFMRIVLCHKIDALVLPGQHVKYRKSDILRVRDEIAGIREGNKKDIKA